MLLLETANQKYTTNKHSGPNDNLWSAHSYNEHFAVNEWCEMENRKYKLKGRFYISESKLCSCCSKAIAEIFIAVKS